MTPAHKVYPPVVEGVANHLERIVDACGDQAAAENVLARAKKEFTKDYAPPQTSFFGRLIANAYRFRVLLTFLATTATTTGLLINDYVHRKQTEAGVEEMVEDLLSLRQTVENKGLELRDSPLRLLLPKDEQTTVDVRLNVAALALCRLRDYFEGLTPYGNIGEAVGPENYTRHGIQAPRVKSELEAIARDLEPVSELLTEEHVGASLNAHIQSLYTTITSSVSGTALAKEAEQAYAQGKGMPKDNFSLAGLADQLELLADRSILHLGHHRKARKLYDEARTASRSEKAVEESDRLHGKAENAYQSGDSEALRIVTTSLQDLTVRLEEVYRLRVAGQPYTRNHRQEEGGMLVKLWYVPVEAVSDDGSVVPRPITDGMTGEIQTVSAWGICVAKGTAEKAKPGDEVGAKRAGYLGEKYTVWTAQPRYTHLPAHLPDAKTGGTNP